MAIADEIYLDNDYYMEVGPIIGLSTTTGLEVLMTGWNDVKAKICATDNWDAVPLDATLEVTLTEEGTTGVYRGNFEGNNLSVELAAYVDAVVYLHIYRQSDYHVVSPVTVRMGRVVA